MITFNSGLVNYIENFSKKTEEKRILDVGCGSGFYTNFFGKRNHLIGIDIQNKVKKEYRNFKFVISSAIELPFDNDIFDLVISFDVIEHIKKDKKAISESYRVLKKGGRIFWGTPNRIRLSNLIVSKLSGRRRKYPMYLGIDEDGIVIHLREYSPYELLSLAEGAGLRNIKIEPFWFGLTPLKYGFKNVPAFIKRHCHYLFITACK